ncbi:MAG: hypothetical protein K6G65_08180 [Lachnospiraceae bacterium]|nr:hypothetical protein [Lachnospiraceae bacterium]
MMKKITIGIGCAVIMAGIIGAGAFVNAGLTPSGKFVKLREEANKESVSEDVVIKGKNTEITEAEIKDAAIFYEAQGESQEDAIEDAKEELEEYHALYSEASKKGYTVTEKEVADYVSELRKTVSEADNSEEVKVMIEAYGDEDKYWEHMKEVYMTRLVVEKYTHDLLEDFNEKYTGELETDEYNKAWDKYFNGIKEDAVNREKFKTE